MRHHAGIAPRHADFQRFFSLRPPSVNSMLIRLEQRGFIRRIEPSVDPTLSETPRAELATANIRYFYGLKDLAIGMSPETSVSLALTMPFATL